MLLSCMDGEDPSKILWGYDTIAPIKPTPKSSETDDRGASPQEVWGKEDYVVLCSKNSSVGGRHINSAYNRKVTRVYV